MAKDKLAEMGNMKPAEWVMLTTFVLLLVLWIFGDNLGVHSTSENNAAIEQDDRSVVFSSVQIALLISFTY
jgi:di/tricarboxylate transporter